MMTGKLTLPIQTGKKYVRRDGQIVTARFVSGDLARVGDDYGSNCLAWRVSGRIYSQPSSAEHPRDLVADYIEPEAKQSKECPDAEPTTWQSTVQTEPPLTRREQFAMAAMQGLMQNRNVYGLEGQRYCAAEAASMADALIAELDKEDE